MEKVLKDLLGKVLQDLSKEVHLHPVKASHLHKADKNQKRWTLMMIPLTQTLDLRLHPRKVHPHLKEKDLQVQVQISHHLKEKVHLPTKGDT